MEYDFGFEVNDDDRLECSRDWNAPTQERVLCYHFGVELPHRIKGAWCRDCPFCEKYEIEEREKMPWPSTVSEVTLRVTYEDGTCLARSAKTGWIPWPAELGATPSPSNRRMILDMVNQMVDKFDQYWLSKGHKQAPASRCGEGKNVGREERWEDWKRRNRIGNYWPMSTKKRGADDGVT